MPDVPAVTATFAEVEVLKGLWELQREGKKAGYLSEVREKVCARRRSLGLPEPALTTVSTTLRNGVAKGVFSEMQLTDGNLEPIVRSGVRSSLGATRLAQKVAYAAALTPSDVLPQMLRELASLYPENIRSQAVVELATLLEFPEEVVRKIAGVLKKA